MNEIDTSLQQLAMLQRTPEYKAQLAKEDDLRRNEKPKPKYDPISGKWVVRNWDGTIAGIPTATSSGEPPRSFDEINEVQPSEIPPLKEQQTETITDVQMSDIGSSNDSTNLLPTKPISMIFRAAVSITDCYKNPTLNPPLARVESVADNSPASLAGLKVNDQIIAFGPIVHTFDTASLSTLVQSAAMDKEMIEIVCQRSTTDNDDMIFLLIQLSPQPWHGRGFLGCHIVPC